MKIIVLLCGLMLGVSVYALTFSLPENNGDVVGAIKHITTINGDTLSSIGRRYEVGIVALMEANALSNIDTHFAAGDSCVVATQFILPHSPHKGIVLNLAEPRLYFYPPNTREVITFPMGVGRQGEWMSPMGETYIARKKVDPTWTPTKHIHDAHLKEGVLLPKNVAPGPANPLGPYALYTNIPAILIHGSNDASGIGRRSSSGCFRLQPEAIESFYALVPNNLLVTIIDEPIKVGWLANKLSIEVHRPLDEDHQSNVQQLVKLHALMQEFTRNRPTIIDWQKADQALQEQRGYPIEIGIGSGLVSVIQTPINPRALVEEKKVESKYVD